MTGAPSDEDNRRIEAAYSWAVSMIALARELIAGGGDVDLAPIRPAIRDLCALLKSLPKDDADGWLARLVGLQHELASLGRELAERERTSGGSPAILGEPGE
jgi:uncharacterized protein HemX